MSALMEQHERWDDAKRRLWPVPKRDSGPRKREVMQQVLDRIETAPEPVEKPPLFIGPIVEISPLASVMSFKGPHWRAIAEQVAAKHGVSFKEMCSRTRRHPVVAARQEAFWRIRKEVYVLGKPMSLPEIGRRFGKHDHTTVLHGIRKHQERMAAEA